jgi:hypothetical protein
MTLAAGHTVERLQTMLMALGYPLPRWGADGKLGDETFGALALFFRDHGAESPGEITSVTDEEYAWVERVFQSAVGIASGPQLAPGKFVDLRAEATRVHVYGKRTWQNVTGITLHQTACVLGERPGRWAGVGAHVGVTRGGTVIHLHDFTELVVHGNGWNTQCVGIEMDGLYEGIAGDLSTLWDDPSTPMRERPNIVTNALIEAAKAAVRWICADVARHGGHVRFLVAHRQSSETRQNDPGSALWQAVALPLQAELGLSDGGAGFAIGKGRPIPEAWDPSRVGIKY